MSVFGHSLGEIAAAHAAGVFSLEDGLRFAAARGALIGALPGEGAMAAVFAPAAGVAAALEQHNASGKGIGLCIAADNGAHQVISGPAAEIAAILERFEAQDIRVARLRKSPAYHSAMVEPALDDLEAVLSTMSFSPPSLTFVSNLTGRAIEPGQTLDAAYWRRQAREPVAFRACVETLAEIGVDALVEIGPHAVLGPMATLSWPESARGERRGADHPGQSSPAVRILAGAGRGRRLRGGGRRRVRGGLSDRLRRAVRRRGTLPHPVAGLSVPAPAPLGRGPSGGARTQAIPCWVCGTNRPAARPRSRRRYSSPTRLG